MQCIQLDDDELYDVCNKEIFCKIATEQRTRKSKCKQGIGSIEHIPLLDEERSDSTRVSIIW